MMKLTLSLLNIFLVNQTINQLETHLWNAIDLGYKYPVAILLETGINPNMLYNGRTFLEFAGEKWAKEIGTHRITRMINYENQWIDIIKILLYYGADPCLVNNNRITPYQHTFNIYSDLPVSKINKLRYTPIYRLLENRYNHDMSCISQRLINRCLDCV